MGVYSGELVVPEIPVLLPKLCIAVRVVTEATDPFESLEIRILKGDNETELLTTGPIATPAEAPSGTDGTTAQIAVFAFMLAPFQIDTESIIRVKATTEREELRGRALRIRIGNLPAEAAVQ